MRDTLLMVRNLSKSFGPLQVLFDVSLDVREGEIYGIVGPNGAGKTVLLNCINGIYPVTEGTIVYQGHHLTGLALHKIAPLGLARTFQHIELFSEMTVLDNVLLGGHFRIKTTVLSGGFFLGRGRREEIKARIWAEEIMEMLELDPYRKEPVGNLPFGIQKLVGLARAMAIEPKLLLLDEIAAGLNREEKEDLARLLLRVREERNVTMVWVEHDMRMITDLADRIVCLNYGKKLAEGTPEDVMANPEVVEAYIGAKH